MNITCDIIRDLLPLYAEDMVSEDSKKLVDEHLCQCDPCTKQLAIMKKVQTLPMDVEVESLKRVGNTIRRRRILAVLTTLLFVVTVVMSGALFLDAQIYLTAEQAVEFVEVLEDGSIRVHWTDDFSIAGTCSLGSENPYSDEPTGNYGIIVWTSLSNLLFQNGIVPYEEMMAQLPEDIRNSNPISKEEYNTKTYQLEGGASAYNLWYCSSKDGTGETLLWDAGNPAPEGAFIEVNYHLAYYCATLAVLAVLLTLFGRKFGGKWYGELCSRIAILCGCMCLSAIIVSAGQFMELYGEFTENVINSTIVAVPMTFTALFGRQLYLLNKQDSGEYEEGLNLKKIVKALPNILYFIPAVIVTLVVLWIYVYPWLDQLGRSDIPFIMLLALLPFWIGGILLQRGKWYGGAIPAILVVWIYFDSQKSMSHVDWLPIAAVTVLYYAICGALSFWQKNKRDQAPKNK